MSDKWDRGERPRWFHERAKVEAQEGSPVRRDVSEGTRRRLVREIEARALLQDVYGDSVDFSEEIFREIHLVFGVNPSKNFADYAASLSGVEFLGLLELCINMLLRHRPKTDDVHVIQSLLADDLCAFRLRPSFEDDTPSLAIELVDNAHLEKQIVDRTFELTQNAAFESAQRDYSEAWKHYMKGDFDDAVVNAHKAFESACKVIVKRLDPASKPEAMQTNQLIPELTRLDIIPGRLTSMLNGLNSIFMSAGTLRNTAGTGHGSVDLTGPEATVALMALRMSGTLVAFIVERWEQMKPKLKPNPLAAS